MGMSQDPTPHGLVDIKVSGHYNSEHLLDCTTYQFSLCELCLRKLFNSFALPPKVFEYMMTRGDIMGEYSYAEDREQYEKCRATQDARKKE